MAKSIQTMQSATRVCKRSNPWRLWQMRCYASRYLAARGLPHWPLRPIPAGDYRDPAAAINRPLPTGGPA